MVGMMGAGKTAIGTALAKRLHVPFLDSDTEISQAAKMTIAEIFERDGEDFFRDRESEVISRLLDGTPCILSTGGGAYLREVNRSIMKERGTALWLQAELELLWQRVKHKNTRPLLQTDDPRATLAAIQAERDPIYALADITVAAAFGLSVDDMTDRVVAELLKHPDVLEKVQ